MGVSRRTFLAWSSLLGGAAALTSRLRGGGTGLIARTAEAAGPDSEEVAYYTACARNCGSKCILKAYVKDGAIVRMGTDDAAPDNLPVYAAAQMARGQQPGRAVLSLALVAAFAGEIVARGIFYTSVLDQVPFF